MELVTPYYYVIQCRRLKRLSWLFLPILQVGVGGAEAGFTVGCI